MLSFSPAPWTAHTQCVRPQMAAMSPGLQSPLQSRGSREFKAALDAMHTPDGSPERSPEKPGCRGHNAATTPPGRGQPEVSAAWAGHV